MTGFFQRLFAKPSSLAHQDAINRAAKMVHSPDVRALARAHGLDVVDVTWEDTGRFKGSCVGPNISDMTIQVARDREITCMPVIRYPNFSDKTADISIDDIVLRVGNHKGASLANVTLRSYLQDLRKHLTNPASWKGTRTSLLAPREKEVLVSAQACFLPVPAHGTAEFNPVLFNYQSYAGAPAVLAIVATREGTSATIIDNQRDGFGTGRGWGQRLFFNQHGERASFTGTRLSEFVATGGDATDKVGSAEEAKSRGLSCVMLIQVPLLQPQLARRSMPMMCAAPASAAGGMAERASCDLEEAVIGHGAVEGPFTEIDNLAIERDARFPIRVTVQFYKATATGIADAIEIKAIADQIAAVYSDAKAVGSLVCDADKGRSTEWDDGGAGKSEPAGWWERFWLQQESATGKTRAQLLADLERLLGRKPHESELESALLRLFGPKS